MHFFLRDISGPVVTAWQDRFAGCVDVTVSEGDIFSHEAADAIVSPANSFGFMDGGIDLAYSMRFGWELEQQLRARLKDEHHGELPVGQALIVPTDDAKFPLLICAPTMRVPMDVSQTVNAFLAFRAVIVAARSHNAMASTPIRSILCPGLGTAVGRMAPAACARQMYQAYVTAHLERLTPPADLMEASRRHFELLGHEWLL